MPVPGMRLRHLEAMGQKPASAKHARTSAKSSASYLPTKSTAIADTDALDRYAVHQGLARGGVVPCVRVYGLSLIPGVWVDLICAASAVFSSASNAIQANTGR